MNYLRQQKIDEYNNLFTNLLKDIYCEDIFNSIINSRMYYNVSNCQTLKNELLNYIKYNVKQICFINNDDLDRIDIHNNLKNIEGINLFNFFNKVKNTNANVNISSLLMFCYEKQINCGYSYELPSIEYSYMNMQINFEFNEIFKYKVCKFNNEKKFYIIIFFDISHDNNFIFNNYNEIIDLNSFIPNLEDDEIDLT